MIMMLMIIPLHFVKKPLKKFLKVMIGINYRRKESNLGEVIGLILRIRILKLRVKRFSLIF